jgi:hypothetical protein
MPHPSNLGKDQKRYDEIMIELKRKDLTQPERDTLQAELDELIKMSTYYGGSRRKTRRSKSKMRKTLKRMKKH